ncbi:MAG TPA: rod shape-determining protein MreC [Dongiaceae bacterium]|nr:rod shape-determining protein MreC [Dongiaceae bacterium]
MKRPTYIVVSLVVLLTLIVLNLPSHTKGRLKLGIGSLFLPLLGLAGSSQHFTGAMVDRVAPPRGELLRQNEAMSREIQGLRFEKLEASALSRENARLRQLLGWQAQQPRKHKLASVVLRDPSNWWRSIQIDLGSRDGIGANQAVVSPEGALVGRTSFVGLTRSQVVLLGDPNCHVAALVENESRDNGVIGASGPMDSGFVELGYLSRNADLKPGQLVKTSGLGGIFPKDILIGQIVDTQPIEYGFGTVARVKLAVNLDALEEVWVVEGQ